MRSGTLLPPVRPLPAGAAELRSEVRGFLAAERAAETFVPGLRRLALRMGRVVQPPPGRTRLGRHDDTAGVRRARTFGAGSLRRGGGAPGRRGSGRGALGLRPAGRAEPAAVRQRVLKRRYLPAIARGECYFAIGLSEPDAGSDLAAVRTTGTRAAGGWTVSGTKIWTSGAHRAHALIALLRTGPPDGRQRHVGLSQLLIELGQPGVTIRPIISMTGEHHFNEVVFDGVFVPDEQVVGAIGEGWAQVTSELAYERSGPERLLSTFVLLDTLAGELASRADDAGSARAVGRVVSRLWACRQMSLAVAGALAAGEAPEIAAALVKDVGTRLESEIIEVARMLIATEPDPEGAGIAGLLAHAVLHAPGFTLRGGTNEILRGIVARGLALR